MAYLTEKVHQEKQRLVLCQATLPTTFGESSHTNTAASRAADDGQYSRWPIAVLV